MPTPSSQPLDQELAFPVVVTERPLRLSLRCGDVTRDSSSLGEESQYAVVDAIDLAAKVVEFAVWVFVWISRGVVNAIHRSTPMVFWLRRKRSGRCGKAGVR
jgi:hypothetical protein